MLNKLSLVAAVLLILTRPTFAQTGEWHVNANGHLMTLSVSQQREKYIAFLANNSGCNEKLDSVAWDSETNSLEFRRSSSGFTQWYRVGIEDGIMIGRFSHEVVEKAAKPSNPLVYRYHITGWNQDEFDNLATVVFDVTTSSGYRG